MGSSVCVVVVCLFVCLLLMLSYLSFNGMRDSGILKGFFKTTVCFQIVNFLDAFQQLFRQILGVVAKTFMFSGCCSSAGETNEKQNTVIKSLECRSALFRREIETITYKNGKNGTVVFNRIHGEWVKNYV